MEPHLHRQMFEVQRQESFKHWPFGDSDRCSVKKMAEAGFYWRGTADEPDSAACFLCGKLLDNWERDDDPWLEHRKHAPQCMFAILNRPEAQLTVNEFLGIAEKMAATRLDRQQQRGVQRVRQHENAAREKIVKYFHDKLSDASRP